MYHKWNKNFSNIAEDYISYNKLNPQRAGSFIRSHPWETGSEGIRPHLYLTTITTLLNWWQDLFGTRLYGKLAIILIQNIRNNLTWVFYAATLLQLENFPYQNCPVCPTNCHQYVIITAELTSCNVVCVCFFLSIHRLFVTNNDYNRKKLARLCILNEGQAPKTNILNDL